MQKRNYQKEMEGVIASLSRDAAPGLLLHSCCAPCSSSVLETLAAHFSVTLFYYNPNIFPEEEYQKRVQEQKRLIAAIPLVHPVSFWAGEYDPDRFFASVRGLEKEPEGGKRCEVCFRLRLQRAAQAAAEKQFSFFTTTLTVSPLKNAPLLNAIGEEMGKTYGVQWLPCDFKKKEGYKRSVALSKEYDLYRQDYCGCVFSQKEREENRRKKEEVL